MSVGTDVVTTVRELYDRGLYLQAFEASQELGPLKSWHTPAARMLASRLAIHLGAPRLSLWHRLKAWREAPHDPEVRYYYAWTILEYDGPYDTLAFLRQDPELADANTDTRSAWFSLHASVLAMLRDFQRAGQWHDRAMSLAPENPWIHTSLSGMLQYQDKFPEALAACDDALQLRPWFRPAVQSRASILSLLGRDEEAFDFLQEAASNLECAAIYLQLASIHLEREEFAEVTRCVELFEQNSPLIERHFASAFHGLRSFLAYRTGDDESAIAHARRFGDELGAKLVDRMSDPERRNLPRKCLPVNFIRQHHNTCGPTTLAMITNFWNRPAEHLEVAERICYNGTTNYHERRWASENGWAVREFTVNECSAQTAIDAGLPFTLTTNDVGSSHLQAVIGYDARRGSIIIRDPSVRDRREIFADAFEKDYGAFGPRGMLIVPIEDAAKLATLDLPDTDLWNLLFEFDGALEEHRRADANAALVQLTQLAPDHVLTANAKRRMGYYDVDSAACLTAIESLLAKYPENDLLKLERISLLRNLSRRDERLQVLKDESDKPFAHPAYVLQYAQELQADARQQTETEQLLRKAIRRNPRDASAYSTLAQLFWDRQDFETGLDLYRLAACLEDRSEHYLEWYFRAAMHCRKTDEVLDWLWQRFEQYGEKSSLPARTLDWALCRLDRTREGLALLEEAIRIRPDDGELKLYAASAYISASTEYTPRAWKLLAEARDHCPPSRWLRTAAHMAILKGDRPEALRMQREALALQPMATDLHSAIAGMLADTESQEAALAHLRSAVEQFPHYQPLLELYIQWLRTEPATAIEPVIRNLIELNPANAWAIRELGFVLIRERRFDEAEQYCQQAGELDPQNIAWHHLRGDLAAARGNLESAREAFREAILLSIDDDYAIDELLTCCHTPTQRRAELEFIRAEIQRQVIYGDGLLSYRRHAAAVLPPETLLEHLREAYAARSDLWHAWVALSQQLVDMQRPEEALAIMREATSRFPLLPRIWVERARVSKICGEEDDELSSLEAAQRINPHWHEILRQLSDVYIRRGELERAQAILESAVAQDASDGVTRGWLADVLWQRGERAKAVEQVQKAIEFMPSYEWAWNVLHLWAAEVDQPELVAQAARNLVATRPEEARSWYLMAKNLEGPEHFEERLAALDKAIELYPRTVDARSWKARILAEQGRFDEALAVCQMPIVGEQVPAGLLARSAWIRWLKGDRDEALVEIKQALAFDPNLYTLWQQLADWYAELQDAAGYMSAAKEMLRIDPYGETTLGYFAEAQLRNEDRVGAKATFARVFEMAPSYEYAGNCLFDLQLEDSELDAAAETVARLRRHSESPFVLARAAQLAAKQDNSAEAAELLGRLCVESSEESSWPLQATFEAMYDREWFSEMNRVLTAALDLSDSIPSTAGLWVRTQFAMQKPNCQEKVVSLLDRGPLGEKALYAWCEIVSKFGMINEFRDLLNQFGTQLSNNTFAWGCVSLAWTVFRNWTEALPWARNWRDHPDAQPWMLVNIAEIFRANQLDAEGGEVSRVALEKEGHGVHLHRLWLAADDLQSGRASQAAEQLAQVNPQELDDDYGFLYALIAGCVEISLAPQADRGAIFARLRPEFIQLGKNYANMQIETARKRFYKFAVNYIAKESGQFWAKLWAWWAVWKV